ncbi:dTDP-4-amino-4,6-dideoxygalactose transaminase [soil metagenome]
MKIPFNKPFLTGKELEYIKISVESGTISGNGIFTQKCQDWFKEKYGFNKTLLTSSCTDALEMASILTDIKPGDEIIIPSYTFVSTANAFVLRGAKIVFADSYKDHPNLDADKISQLITEKTKAIVPVHYGGVACDMDKIISIAKENNLYVIEDAAQCIDSFYKGKPLGSLGDLGAFSFHESKNIISGEGGMLCINNGMFNERSEIIWEKGTNRSAFYRGEVNKYEWIDVGSSFLPSDIIAAFLFSQLEHLSEIQSNRLNIWNKYYNELIHLQNAGKILLPVIPEYATNNAHLFYILTKDLNERNELIEHMMHNGIQCTFHYLSLKNSPFYSNEVKNDSELLNADRFSEVLVRLPLFYHLKDSEINYVIDKLKIFYNKI